MAENKKYENYDKLMNIIYNLRRNKYLYEDEKNMVIELIQLFPKAVKKYIEYTLSSTLKILDVSIDDYTIKVIDYAIEQWKQIESPMLNLNKGSLTAFLKVFNADYTAECVDLSDYDMLYNFYRVLYDSINTVLPEYVDANAEYDDADTDKFPKFLSVEDMIPEVSDLGSDLDCGYDEYHLALDKLNYAYLFDKFIEKIKDIDDPKAIWFRQLKDHLRTHIIAFYDGYNIYTKDIITDIVDITTNNIYDMISMYAMTVKHPKRDSILLLLYGNNNEINLIELCNDIFENIKTAKNIINAPFALASMYIDNLLNGDE